mmetsp:Transcript_44556/g.102880  ORF Transcript_44556/g.102880 Transcript_44556/m.102880 type:complete len:201 (-) Transcript_44556:1005-1607(-)
MLGSLLFQRICFLRGCCHFTSQSLHLLTTFCSPLRLHFSLSLLVHLHLPPAEEVGCDQIPLVCGHHALHHCQSLRLFLLRVLLHLLPLLLCVLPFLSVIQDEGHPCPQNLQLQCLYCVSEGPGQYLFGFFAFGLQFLLEFPGCRLRLLLHLLLPLCVCNVLQPCDPCYLNSERVLATIQSCQYAKGLVTLAFLHFRHSCL